MIQGTNGILTVSFIVVLLLCGVGFLIFWILSIQSRALQFGIFRAMGMSMKEILQMLLGEQAFITGSAIVAGILIGLAGSYLYIPLIQIAYGSADSMIPLSIQPAASDLVKIFVVVALIIGICMVVLGKIIKEIKISQALKLGED
jgi:putative ABC transport system permease protein